MTVTHIDAATLTPELYLNRAISALTAEILDEVADRTGLPQPDVEVRWMPADAFVSQRDGDRYQAIHRTSVAMAAYRPRPTASFRPHPPVDLHGVMGCPAAYILGQDTIIAARPPEGMSFPIAALGHALIEAIVCRHLGTELDTLLDRYPLDNLWAYSGDLSDRATRAYNKLYLLRATTLGLTQVAVFERCGTLFSRSAMHRLWDVPMATTLTALTIATDPELQRIVPTTLHASPMPSRSPSPMSTDGPAWVAPRADTPFRRSPSPRPRMRIVEEG